MNKDIFKIKDRVYCCSNGWGNIVNIILKDEYGMCKYPIVVSFDNNNIQNYTIDGRYIIDSIPTLSFTEYTLSGFSQKRPLPNIKSGTLIYVKSKENSIWEMRYFSHFNSNNFPCCFITQNKKGPTNIWEHYSLTNPLV